MKPLRKTAVAEHQVEVKFPPTVILNKDAVFEVMADEDKLGQLTVSKGSIGWFSPNAPVERHLIWKNFDQMIRQLFEI